MGTSVFLARLLGFYLVIIGLLYLSRRHFIQKAALEIFDQSSFIIISGVISLIIGLLIVVAHNVWIWDWPVVITVLGYLSLIKGIARLFIPGGNKKLALKCTQGSSPIFIGIICLIFGLFLIYEGFIGIEI